MTASWRRAAFPLLVLVLVLAACRAAPSPSPAATPAPPATPTATPVSPPTVAATATLAPAPSVSPTPGADALPASWQEEANDQLSIAVPPGWRAIKLRGADAQATFDALKQNDARLAGIIGSPEALQGAAFWALGPEEGGFVDNLNIRRSPLGAQRVSDIQQVIDVLLPEYEKMGLKVTSTDATLRVNEHVAARITYTLMMNTADGKGFEVRGRQIIVATDSDLWILSFSTLPEREGEMAAQFERSAQSFRLK
jgi:hypothetical protein